MSPPETVSLILPAFNEAPRLRESIERIDAFFAQRPDQFEVIVVDDASTDATATIVEGLAATHRWLRLVRQGRNRGKGAAIRRGVAEARAADVIAFLDADLTIPVDVLDTLLHRLRSGEADIAVASRYVPGSRVRRPTIRRVMGTSFRLFVRLTVPTGVQDTQCGGKAYRAELARRLFALQRIDGFSFDAEVLFLARRQGYRVVEVPFELVQERRTSLHLLRETFRMLRDLLLIRLNAARGRYG